MANKKTQVKRAKKEALRQMMNLGFTKEQAEAQLKEIAEAVQAPGFGLRKAG